MRLDLFLASQFPRFSRSFFQKFIRRRGLRVNEALVRKPHASIREADHWSLSEKELNEFLAAQSSTESAPAEILKTSILYSGITFLVVDKPPFVRTEKIAQGFFPVHRLDKDTSGVLVLAKDPQTKAQLQEQWQQHTVRKTYVALVKGILSPKKGAIEAGIFRSLKDRKKMAVSSHPRARAATTEYEVLNYVDAPMPFSCTLLKISPKTGRTHQIRVHFSAIEHPVIGDKIYGDEKLNNKFEQEYGLKRQFLHAIKLELVHPRTHKKITFEAKLPEDLQSVLDKIK